MAFQKLSRTNRISQLERRGLAEAVRTGWRFKTVQEGLPGWSSVLPMLGAALQSLVRELDPTCCNYEFAYCNK